MSQDFVTVLDLGSTKAVALAAKMEAGQVKVLSVASTPCKGMRKGQVLDIEEVGLSISVVLRRITADVGDALGPLVVAITGPGIDGMLTQGLKPIIPRTRIVTHQDVLEVINHSRSVLMAPEMAQIQAIPREFRVDGQRDVRRPVGMSATKLEVTTYLVNGPLQAIQNLERAVTLSGNRIDQLVLASLAAGIGVLTPEEMETGTAVLDIGGGTADLAVFTNGSISHSASVPLGGQHVTNDISLLLKTSAEEADRLKFEHGSATAEGIGEDDLVDVMQLGHTDARALQRKVLCEIIESRMREIATMVKQHLARGAYESILPGGLVLTGGAAHLKNADKLFAEMLKLRVRVAEPDLGARHLRQPGMAVAAGLARFALQCQDEIGPAVGQPSWQNRVRSLFSMLGGRR